MITALLIVLAVALAYSPFTPMVNKILKAGLILLTGIVLGGSFLSFFGAWAGIHAIHSAFVRKLDGKDPFDDSASTLGQFLLNAGVPYVDRFLWWAYIVLFITTAIWT